MRGALLRRPRIWKGLTDEQYILTKQRRDDENAKQRMEL